jgi:hypothetical protein
LAAKPSTYDVANRLQTGARPEHRHGQTASVGVLVLVTGLPCRREKNGSQGGGFVAVRTPTSTESALSRVD